MSKNLPYCISETVQDRTKVTNFPMFPWE